MTHLYAEQRSELHYAALADDEEEVGRLIPQGSDPNLTDRLGFTPLHLAAQEFALGAARLLLAHGAEVAQVNTFGNTALFTAVFNSRGRGEMIVLLRKAGANPNRLNASGQSPLGLATYRQLRCCSIFRRCLADPCLLVGALLGRLWT